MTTKLISVKSHVKNINLHPLIIKFLNAEKTILQKDYRFGEAFNDFAGTDNKLDKLKKHKTKNFKKTKTKNVMLQYLRIMEDKLFDMCSTPSIIKNVNNANYK